MSENTFNMELTIENKEERLSFAYKNVNRSIFIIWRFPNNNLYENRSLLKKVLFLFYLTILFCSPWECCVYWGCLGT